MMRTNWLVWALIVVGLLLLFVPFFGIVAAAVKATLWVIGGLLLLIGIIWAVTALSRATSTATTPM